jgi:hypothetical protein
VIDPTLAVRQIRRSLETQAATYGEKLSRGLLESMAGNLAQGLDVLGYLCCPKCHDVAPSRTGVYEVADCWRCECGAVVVVRRGDDGELCLLEVT